MTEAQMDTQHLVVSRVFDADRDRLWTAWTTPSEITRWWGPNGFVAVESSIELEPREGGVFRLTMHSAEHGIEVPMDAHFLAVDPGERLVYTEPTPCLPAIRSVVGTLTLTDAGSGKTEVTLDITMETSDEIRTLSETGWHESFDRLATVLAE
ncbi:SRPBCC domain-containing protein [Actinokineospora soli]|uniref:SRPBCC domain-containing protein n=1 Tax=Actinokineospora soli TaxID=1048753 RepID=A0ABW2TLR5_9PSEU